MHEHVPDPGLRPRAVYLEVDGDGLQADGLPRGQKEPANVVDSSQHLRRFGCLSRVLEVLEAAKVAEIVCAEARKVGAYDKSLSA